MMRTIAKTVLVGLVLVAALAAWNSEARAWWGWGAYPPAYGYYAPGVWSSCDYPCYSGGWYAGWRPGPPRRLMFGPYRWYYGGYGYYTASCCGYGWAGYGYDPCCYGTVSYGVAPSHVEWGEPQPQPTRAPERPTPGADLMPDPPEPPETPGIDTPWTPAPVDPAAPSGILPGMQLDPSPPVPAEPPTTIPGFRLDSGLGPMPDGSQAPTRQTSGLLTVWVPFGAEVTINGHRTQSTGSRRQYVSYGLLPGYSYTYVVEATMVENGQKRTETHRATLTAGDEAAVVFTFQPAMGQGLAAHQ